MVVVLFFCVAFLLSSCVSFKEKTEDVRFFEQNITKDNILKYEKDFKGLEKHFGKEFFARDGMYFIFRHYLSVDVELRICKKCSPDESLLYVNDKEESIDACLPYKDGLPSGKCWHLDDFSISMDTDSIWSQNSFFVYAENDFHNSKMYQNYALLMKKKELKNNICFFTTWKVA